MSIEFSTPKSTQSLSPLMPEQVKDLGTSAHQCSSHTCQCDASQALVERADIPGKKDHRPDGKTEQLHKLEDYPEILRIDEVAQILRISRTTAYEHARQGLLPAPVAHSGRRLFVAKAALLKGLGVTE